MKTRGWLSALAVPLLTLTRAVAGAADSAAVLVDSDLKSAHWSTAFTNAIPLSWDWHVNVASARLDIAGMGGVFCTNLTSAATSCLWRAFAAEVPAAEDVYDLTLTVYGGGGAASEVLTSRLAVVRGAFGAASVNAVPGSPLWTKVKSDVVIPYDAAWAEGEPHAASARLVIAQAGGAAQTNAYAAVAGCAGWKIRNTGWGYGTFDLALTFPGTTNAWQAELTRSLDGTAICVK